MDWDEEWKGEEMEAGSVSTLLQEKGLYSEEGTELTEHIFSLDGKEPVHEKV